MADDDDDVAEVDAGGGGDIDAGANEDYQQLITGDWTLSAGEEGYYCAYKTMDRTVYATAFRPDIPVGTHHTVLTMGSPQRADGVYPCNAGTNYGKNVFGSGVGTNALVFPEGYAVKIEEGTQLLLNLHLYNFGDAPLDGTSGTSFIEIPEADVVNELEALMAARFSLNIPPGESSAIGTCLMNGDATLISVSPHMHMMGSHMKVWAESSTAGDVTLLDAPYDFDQQTVELLPNEIPMQAGDALKVECTWNNTGSTTLQFGDSSDQEMCIAGVYRYPPRGGGIFCATN